MSEPYENEREETENVDSAFEIHAGHKVIKEVDGQSVEYMSDPWIKLSTSFRENYLAQLKGPKLSVFLCIALHINEAGKCEVGTARIMKETNLSRVAVINARNTLEAIGLLSITRKKIAKTKHKVNRYTVNLLAAYGNDQPMSDRPSTKNVLPKNEGGSKLGVLPLVNQEHYPSTPDVPKEEPLKKNHLKKNQELKTTTVVVKQSKTKKPKKRTAKQPPPKPRELMGDIEKQLIDEYGDDYVREAVEYVDQKIKDGWRISNRWKYIQGCCDNGFEKLDTNPKRSKTRKDDGQMTTPEDLKEWEKHATK